MSRKVDENGWLTYEPLEEFEQNTSTAGTSKSVTINPPKPVPRYGWVCPVCGRGLSPFTSVCPCKGVIGIPKIY